MSETLPLAILSDAPLMQRLRQGEAALAAGETVSLGDLRSRLRQTTPG